MKLLLLLLLLLPLACRDQDPPERGIEGVWEAQPPAHPLWTYEFRPPHLRQWVVDFGGNITEQHYLYAVVGDTLFASGAGGQRTWLLRFPDDSTCEYRVFTSIHLSPVYRLRRLE